MLKAVYDPQNKTRNLVTTITGIVTLVITVLVGFGIIKPEQQVEVQNHATTLISAVQAIISAVSGLILIFKAKDA